MKLYFFSCGFLKSTKGLFVNGGGNDAFCVPVPFFLIQHRGKNILFDTGNHCADMSGHLQEKLTRTVRPVFREEELAHHAIQTLGVQPENIDFIILSHLHHDHAGEICQFPNATVIVQQAEYDYAHRTDYFMEQTYYADEVPAQGIDWYFLQGKADDRFDLFGDGRIVIYYTPGHTIGHQSLLVRTEKDGAFLLAADACYTAENIADGVLPGLVLDSHAYLHNLVTFRLLQKTGVTIVPGHDPLQWQQFRHAPEYYA
jgi:N-acyl homoserine lactone hydrolase